MCMSGQGTGTAHEGSRKNLAVCSPVYIPIVRSNDRPFQARLPRNDITRRRERKTRPGEIVRPRTTVAVMSPPALVWTAMMGTNERNPRFSEKCRNFNERKPSTTDSIDARSRSCTRRSRDSNDLHVGVEAVACLGFITGGELLNRRIVRVRALERRCRTVLRGKIDWPSSRRFRTTTDLQKPPTPPLYVYVRATPVINLARGRRRESEEKNEKNKR